MTDREKDGARVVILCGAPGCNHQLKTLTERDFPPEGHPYWTDPHHPEWVRPCPKHGGTALTLEEENAERAAKGRPLVVDNILDRLSLTVSYSDLRPKYLESVHSGRASHYHLPPRHRRL